MPIPTDDEVRRALAVLGRRRGLTGPISELGIRNALSLARELAASGGDETAALVFAFSKYPKALTSAWAPFVFLLAVNGLNRCGRELTASHRALAALRIGIAGGDVSFDQVAPWLREHSRSRPR